MRTKKSNIKNDFYYHILELLENGVQPKHIRKRLNLSYQGLNYYLRQLKENNNIEKVGYGTWKVKQKELKKVTMYGRKIRGHAFRFKIIPKHNHYQSLIKKLEKKNIKFKRVGINKKTYSFKFKTKTIWICSNGTIDIIFRRGESKYRDSALASHNSAWHTALSITKALRNRFSEDLTYWKGNFKVKCSKQHYSLIKNELAGELRSRGVNYIEVKGDDGEVWLLVDNSFNLEELEAIHPKKSIRDTDKVLTPFMNTIRAEPRILDKLTYSIQGLVNFNQQYAENIQLHLSTLQEMKETLKAIQEKLK